MSRSMPPRASVDPALRQRLRAWLAYYKRSRKWTNDRLAQELGVTEPTVTMILNKGRDVGLDVMYRMHTKLHRSADDLLDIEPPDDD